jgi:calcineurin-like phosphoesterase family protein
MAVYFTSDLHLGHKNLCVGLRNMTFEESDKTIIENWNKVVKKKDKVFILGDINMENPKLLEQQLSKLTGVKEFILGNHDCYSAATLVKLGFKVCGCRSYKGFLLSHIPVHESQLFGFRGNIHGHIHVPGNIEGLGSYNPVLDLGPKYYNVNTEFHNYSPIPFEEIWSHFQNLNNNF